MFTKAVENLKVRSYQPLCVSIKVATIFLGESSGYLALRGGLKRNDAYLFRVRPLTTRLHGDHATSCTARYPSQLL